MLFFVLLAVCAASALGNEYDVDCAVSGPGNHAAAPGACTTFFYSCGEPTGEGHPPSAAYEFECPSGLKFSALCNQCLTDEDIADCGGQDNCRDLSDEPAMPQELLESNIKFDCTRRRSGSYAHPDKPCSAEYIVCSNGRLIPQVCPNSEILCFDPKSRRCIEPIYIETCGGVATEIPELPTTRAPIEGIDCPAEGVLYLENPNESCSNLYYACSAGFAFEMICPEGLSYDKISHQCLLADFVESCGGVSTTTVEATTNQDHPAPVDYECTEDGNFPAGDCEGYYYACSGLVAYQIGCPGNLFYLAAEDRCVPARKIAECPQDGGDNFGRTSCEGRPDGFYSMSATDCASYAVCQAGEPFYQRCQNEEVFHPGLHKCMPKDRVPVPCGTMDLPPEFTCEGREVGYWRNTYDCSSYFYCETDGSAWSFDCSQGKGFSFERQQCVPLMEVPDCYPEPDVDVLESFCERHGRNGVFAHPDTCHVGVVCLSNIPFLLECPIPGQTRFDRDAMECLANDATCPAE